MSITSEHLELIESLTDIGFDPEVIPTENPGAAVETTLLVLARMAIRRRADGDHKSANAAEEAIEAFGPIYNDLQEEIEAG